MKTNLSEEIKPKTRKRIESYKRLSVEEIWLLDRRKKIINVFPSCVILIWVLKEPFEYFIKALELGNPFPLSALVGASQLFDVVFSSIIFGGIVLLFFCLMDRYTTNYMGKSKKIINKLKKQSGY